jgi:hypothetical protein
VCFVFVSDAECEEIQSAGRADAENNEEPVVESPTSDSEKRSMIPESVAGSGGELGSLPETKFPDVDGMVDKFTEAGKEKLNKVVSQGKILFLLLSQGYPK